MDRSFNSRNFGRLRRFPSARPSLGLALACGLLALAGCNERGQFVTESIPTDGYRTRYPITLQEAPETLDIPVGSGAAGLSASMRDVVLSFADDAAHNATSGIVVMTPSGSANQAAAAYLARDVRTTLMSAGIPARSIEQRPYAVADHGAIAPLRVAFNRIKAVSPPCGRWTEDLIADDNDPGSDGAEFGCATQANLAAMVEDPNDLITPRAQTPIPAWKRWMMMQKDLAGTSPSGTYPSSSF